ncbi:MAG: tRNA (N(6)-L-threonylcarbamoyladenosine(37)-C(2))-methylthiotransferase MtaB [Desulfobacteraceae bacterium 4572_130]|nr:MAG: tRNA (N(6)-L-threonylcarbamoyladenosine(37)-C(2))-methylthiotransferase MtaB [Desulfobacteraceae bacterium 4572_130]
MKKFYIKTLGCKVNQYESDGIACELISHDLIKEKKPNNADICIINTCAVTSKASRQSRQAIRNIIKLNSKAKIIVTGCHAQTSFKKIMEIKNIDCITTHKDKFKIARAIIDKKKGLASIKVPQSNQCSNKIFHSFKPAVTGDKTRAYLKIQDGCNAFCTYCIVPYARGRSVSMQEDEVIEHLNLLNKLKYKEIIITGINLGAYGLDFKKKSSLFILLKKIAYLKPTRQIRLSSIEPKELTNDIITLVAQNDIFCNHFHIPLQSGDDKILKKMKRPYNTSLFKNLILKIHKKIPFAGIGIDILAGFPEETEKAFENTLSLINELPISYLHVFPFSSRKGTLAFNYKNKINPKVIKKRCSIIRQLGEKKTKEFKQKNIEKTLKAIIQKKRDYKTGKLKAVTSNYLNILVNGDNKLREKIVKIKIKKFDSNNHLHGEIKEKIND